MKLWFRFQKVSFLVYCLSAASIMQKRMGSGCFHLVLKKAGHTWIKSTTHVILTEISFLDFQVLFPRDVQIIAIAFICFCFHILSIKYLYVCAKLWCGINVFFGQKCERESEVCFWLEVYFFQSSFPTWFCIYQRQQQLLKHVRCY